MYDQVGSLRVIVDSVGTMAKRIDYDSFGNIINDTNPGFTIPFGFAGGLHDIDTGLVRFGARDLDPGIGRWTAKDPIDFAGGDINLYGYVQNNPVNFVDPYGLWFVDFNFTFGIGAGLGGTIGIQMGPSGVYVYSGGGAGVGAGSSITVNSGDPCPGSSVQATLSGGGPYGIGAKITRSGNYDSTADVIVLEDNFALGLGLGAGAAVTNTNTKAIW
jgi:RHS repeat-associated protein